MKYNIKDTQTNRKLVSNIKLPDFIKKVLASYPLDNINDVLNKYDNKIEFQQMDQAVNLINETISNNEKIVIMGDYDCDGILATSILYNAFNKLNKDVGYYIPNRINDGYGINLDLIKKFIDKDYKLIITVDNGVNAQEAINYALDHGVKVIVTDHHQMDKTFLTDAIYVHPTFSNLDYFVSGGYVSYMLACALLNHEDDYLHALAAITLVSDVMPLIKGNRTFLRKALNNMQNNHYLQIDSLVDGFIDSATIGNIIAPKINSLGRLPDLYDPNKLVAYFNCNDERLIKNFALYINECNNYRKQMTSDYVVKYEDKKVDHNLLMLEEPDLHEGLIGLLASRFSNQYHCVSFIASVDNDIAKASLRSIDGINIYDIINQNKDLFLKYGGHAQAMGLSYEIKNSQKIKEKLIEDLSKLEKAEKIYEVIELQEDELSLDNVLSLRYLEPYGNGFEAPLFLIKNALITNIKGLKNNLHYKLTIIFKNNTFEVMLFNQSELDIKVNDQVDLIVKLGINEFRNNVKVSMILEDYLIK